MRKLTGAVLILLISRIVGMVREFVIALAFGFSYLTDIFYQVTWPFTALVTMTNGPFNTAFSARLAAAPVELRLAHSRYYLQVAFRLGFFFALLILLASILFYAFDNADIALALFVLSPAAFSLTVTGYFYSLATSLGWITLAALQLFVSNLGFVLGITLLWSTGSALVPWLLPGLFSVAMSLGLTVSRVIWNKAKAALPQGNVRALALGELGAGFLLAGLETSAFLLTQGLVVVLATAAGEGWLSATTLVQRVVFSVNGLIVSPFASLLMLHTVQNKSNVEAAFCRGFVKATLGLGLLAFILGGVLPFIDIARLPGDLSIQMQAIDKIEELLPAFSIWLVPMGLNIIVCRTMFGLKLDRLYTITTLIAYLCANLIRIAVFMTTGFGAAIIIGALIELIGTIWLAWRTRNYIRNSRNNP